MEAPSSPKNSASEGTRPEIDLAINQGSGYSPPPIRQIPLATEKTKRKLARRERLLLAIAGGGLLTLLLVAAGLHPSGIGHGTHQQLGLPPCTFLTLFGRPCPTCGMTTAWAHLTKGHWGDACRANVGGALLGFMALLAAPWMLGSAIRGAWIGGPVRDVVLAWMAFTVFIVVLIDWAFRLLA